jgi:hypothetical protein
MLINLIQSFNAIKHRFRKILQINFTEDDIEYCTVYSQDPIPRRGSFISWLAEFHSTNELDTHIDLAAIRDTINRNEDFIHPYIRNGKPHLLIIIPTSHDSCLACSIERN